MPKPRQDQDSQERKPERVSLRKFVDNAAETLHDYSLIDIIAIARALGFEIEKISPGSEEGVDVVLTYGDIEVVIESEVGHEVGGKKYIEKLVKKLEKMPKSGRTRYLVIMTNVPRRIRKALRSMNAEYRKMLREYDLREAELGRDVYVVPALLYREVMPALLAKISACKMPEI
ncbi:hypothetical protein [Pyrobaculum calidifontis]|uniref:Restriction endonuclease type IV Mrr domain-containing protein n=1 Tax=Pyrobaculum calidifontis (strain DSM 21063 / JCM 11548 / VA1) TaxID=410359 RepID=A3MU32_PYRCJ|nr:hypothetical protein [Pyrobaculum calidifontis]ABO08149.1 conserved hypothetical protein [Pyrobaculum calidifontis JCM 11548]